MSIRVSVLGSGSWGNATFIQFPLSVSKGPKMVLALLELFE